MSKSVPFVAILAAVLTVFTYYAVPLLVASETVRKYAPQVEASMERMVRGLQGKTLFCTEDETAPRPELITPRQVISLAIDVGEWVMEANQYDIGVASYFVSDTIGMTAAMGRLYAVGSSFLTNIRSWRTTCEQGSISAETENQLDQDFHEMENGLRDYHTAISKHERGAVHIRILAAILLSLDLSVAVWIATHIRRKMRPPATDSSADIY